MERKVGMGAKVGMVVKEDMVIWAQVASQHRVGLHLALILSMYKLDTPAKLTSQPGYGICSKQWIEGEIATGAEMDRLTLMNYVSTVLAFLDAEHSELIFVCRKSSYQRGLDA